MNIHIILIAKLNKLRFQLLVFLCDEFELIMIAVVDEELEG